MKRGPKPKSTAIKELQGNPGKRALNKQEPTSTDRLPSCPRELSPEAKKVWRQVVREAPEGLLTKADASLLEMYCQLRAFIRKDMNEGNRPNAALMREARSMMASLGLEAASRGNLKADTPVKEEDDFAGYFGKQRVA